MSSVLELLQSTNPLLNDQTLKLGIFSSNIQGGMMAVTEPSSYELTWEHTKAIAQLADRAGFEAMIPVARWRGFGGATDFGGASFETYTWAAGLAEATEQIGIVSTSHVSTVHPLFAAKQGSTIDHISGGRFALNMTMGWFGAESEMFGATQREHDTRYEYGDEWVSILKQLWTSDEPIDFDGRFLHTKNAIARPRPVQQPRPVLVNAGGSPKGLDFSARHADINFVGMPTFEMGERASRRVKELARDEYGREIGTMTYISIICRDTEAEAQRDYNRLVETIDVEGIDYMIREVGAGGNQAYGDGEAIKKLRIEFALGWGNTCFVGTPEQIVDQLQKTSDIGIDGVVLGFHDYLEELAHFDEAVMPLLRQAGLRH